ncbi:MAG: glucose-1-phosphate cytidylyltransferase [Roseitalea porphyridii]|uniref:Glucose-1-phosphate cytidylyltransferase n=1 Tax=Roseitalea porphyridii TaxID=1852022 RepID=A0A4P6V1R9_9HYPH|nr:glucose-1-phosphate cytidylyltransferase [Roseitalea porphyridii]QBK30813.1 glucose-1-phosphate cytidylyltransferase [Roseitalea porphyridii]
MIVVLLAGGMGTRLSEETEMIPKPLVEVGGRPILWHIMKIYEASGFTEFIVCCGYKAHKIKSYFVNYFTENYDLTVHLGENKLEFHGEPSERWKVTLVNTGLETMTGGRIKRIAPYIGDQTFCLSYGDGVADLNIRDVVDFHEEKGRLATVTAVRSPGRFGILDIAEERGVKRFHEKPDNEAGWINGGFFVLEPGVFDFIDDDATSWEKSPLERLAAAGQLSAFQHHGFWKPMDTLRDQRELDEMWRSGNAPWKRWH